MPMPRIAPYLVLVAAPALALLTACGDYENPYSGNDCEFDPDRPDALPGGIALERTNGVVGISLSTASSLDYRWNIQSKQDGC